VSGISLSTDYIYAGTKIEVRNCPGEVVLEAISLQASDHRSSSLLIDNSDNVSVTSLQTSSGYITIDHSRVRLSEVSVSIGHPDDCRVNQGWDAMSVSFSSVVLANATLRGGDGCPGEYISSFLYPGGPGGDGLRANNSDIMIVGNDHVIAGGNGGDGGRDPHGNISGGGHGGNGFEGASAVASRMTFAGGAGGIGNPNGDPGLPWVGTLTENDVVPSLSMSGDLNPGEIFVLFLDVVEAGGILMVFADHQGFLTFPGNAGPPLGAIPGGRFLTFYAGHLDKFGHLTLPLMVPNDPALSGTPLNAQSALLLDAGGFILSNATTRVVGERGW